MPYFKPDNSRNQDFSGVYAQGEKTLDLNRNPSEVPISLSDTGTPFEGCCAPGGGGGSFAETVTALSITGGDLIFADENSVANTVVIISADVGNKIVAGADGKLFVPDETTTSLAISSSVLQYTDENSIVNNVTLISTDASNALVNGTDGKLFVTTVSPVTHGVTQTTVVADYNVITDPGGSNRPVSPDTGAVNLENYDNGLLVEWWSGSVWHSTFFLSCCADATVALTNVSLTPAIAESPTQTEINAYVTANGPYQTNTQITYTSPNGVYMTWIIDESGVAIPHARPLQGFSDEGTVTAIPTTVSQLYKAHYIWDVNTTAGDIDLSTIGVLTNAPSGAVMVFRNTGQNNLLYNQDINGSTATYTMQGIGSILRLAFNGATYQVV